MHSALTILTLPTTTFTHTFIQVTMSKHEDSYDWLDTEFDHFLLDMKPYVLKHPNKTGKTCVNVRSVRQHYSLNISVCLLCFVFLLCCAKQMNVI